MDLLKYMSKDISNGDVGDVSWIFDIGCLIN